MAPRRDAGVPGAKGAFYQEELAAMERQLKKARTVLRVAHEQNAAGFRQERDIPPRVALVQRLADELKAELEEALQQEGANFEHARDLAEELREEKALLAKKVLAMTLRRAGEVEP